MVWYLINESAPDGIETIMRIMDRPSSPGTWLEGPEDNSPGRRRGVKWDPVAHVVRRKTAIELAQEQAEAEARVARKAQAMASLAALPTREDMLAEMEAAFPGQANADARVFLARLVGALYDFSPLILD